VLVLVANGRVHHQNFAINLAGTPLRTSGSVGFDNTLDLVVEVSLPKELPALKNNPVLVKAVAGKTVKVPVRGTLAKPELDPKGFEQAIAAIARDAAKDIGKEAIESELKKLFPGMSAPGATPKLPFPLPGGKKP
jgi:translocation and assembly module TamB